MLMGEANCKMLVKRTKSQADMFNVPQNHTTIFGSSSGVLPSTSSEGSINSRTNLSSSEPGVNNQAGAGIELMRLRGQVDIVDGIQESCGGHLGRLSTTQGL